MNLLSAHTLCGSHIDSDSISIAMAERSMSLPRLIALHPGLGEKKNVWQGAFELTVGQKRRKVVQIEWGPGWGMFNNSASTLNGPWRV